MSARLITEREDEAIPAGAPHLSFSRIQRYLLCPEQYRLHYIENLRPKLAAASLVFGKVIHQALAARFRDGHDPLAAFETTWNQIKNYDLDYGKRDSWEKLSQSGQRLLEKFLADYVDRLTSVRSSEKTFELRITNLDLPLVGIIDLVADLDGRCTVIDFKTSSSAYEDYEVTLSDQLTAYRLAEPAAEQTAFCVFIKTKEPKIQWQLSGRSGEQMLEFLAKAEYVASEIANRRFYKRPGKWCSWCDFLPVCTGDKRKVSETLIQIR